MYADPGCYYRKWSSAMLSEKIACESADRPAFVEHKQARSRERSEIPQIQKYILGHKVTWFKNKLFDEEKHIL